MQRLLFLLASTLALALTARPAAPQDSTGTMSHHGRERRFELHVPRTPATAGPRPLVIVLHGSGQPMAEVRNWLPIDENATILVVRHFFYDWETEVASSLSIERIGGGRSGNGSGKARPAVDPRAVAARQLIALGDFVVGNLEFFLQFSRPETPNTFLPPLDGTAMGAAAENKLAVGWGGEAGKMDPVLETLVRRYCRDALILCRNEESREVLARLGVSSASGTDTARPTP